MLRSKQAVFLGRDHQGEVVPVIDDTITLTVSEKAVAILVRIQVSFVCFLIFINLVQPSLHVGRESFHVNVVRRVAPELTAHPVKFVFDRRRSNSF
jgi:hypothetical protein